MARKKPIISPFGQWAYPGEVTIIPSSDITMKGVNYPVLGIDNLGNQQMMMPGGEYTFPGDYVTEIPQMSKGGLSQWFDEKWVDVKTGKTCGRSGKDKDGRPYPACRPSKRVNETTPKTTSEMSSAEKAKFKREKTSGKRIDYNHKRRQDGGEWLDDEPEVNPKIGWNSGNRYSYDKKGNLIYTNHPLSFDYGVEQFIERAINNKSGWLGNSLNDYEIDFLKNAKNKIQNLDVWPTSLEFQVKTQVDKLNPSLDELINVTQNIYPDQYAIDNSFLKASKSRIDLPASAFENDIKERYVIPDVLKNSINKRFGTLPTTRDDSYSPNRIWTTKVKNDEDSNVGARFAIDEDNSKYAYVLTPNSKKTSDLSKEKINTKKENIENLLSSADNKFYENLYLKYPDYIQYPGNYNNPEISLFGDIKNILPNQMWNRAEQMRVEMLNNPEIKDWADLHNVNLSRWNEDSKQNLVIDGFAPKVPESAYANRLVKAGLPVSTPDYNYGADDTYIVQDPSKFNLAGYFPIPKDYDEENAKQFIAKKLGIKQEQLNSKDYLIHYNKTPITEYTPGKKYGGWLSKYQSGGLSMGDYDLTTAPKRGDYLLPDINRPSYIDEAGNKRSEYRMGVNIDGRETLIPTVVGGKQLSEDEALDRYYKTGLHMGQFNTPEEADYTSRLRTARYNMLEDPIRFQADQFQVGGTLPPIYTSNPRRVQLYQDSLDLYNRYQPSFDKYKNWTKVNNIQTSSLKGNDLFNQYWGPYKPKGASPYNQSMIKPVEEMMHQYIRFRPGTNSYTAFNEKRGNDSLEAKPADYLKPNPKNLKRKIYNIPVSGPGRDQAIERMNASVANRRKSTWPVGVTKQDFLDLALTGVTPDMDSIFRYAKPVQPYILTSDINPEITKTSVPVVEPPKPSLFVSNIDRDMYTPGGGMGREYNIGVTLQDGSKKAFRTEKEYQDWKEANNLDISNAKVTEGKGYSYDYPENKKYGGWLDQFQTGGWANFVPASSTPLLRKDVSGNAGYRDNTRVNTINPATKKAAEAAQYARRVGSISQGKTKSDYEKAREASSFVSQAEQRKGSADPLDYVLDMVNPAFLPFSGIDLVGNTAMGVNNLAKGNFSEAAGNALDAGFNAINVIPATAELRGPLKSAGKYLTTQTPLKNTYKYNPWAFKPNPEAYYRGVGKEGIKDALESRVIKSRDQDLFPSPYFARPNEFKTALYYNPDALIEAKGIDVLQVKNIEPNQIIFKNKDAGAVPLNPEWVDEVYLGNITPGVKTSQLGHLPIDDPNIRLLQKDWLRGYEEIKKPSIQNSVDNIATPNISQSASISPVAWQAQELPGLHLKSTMTDGPISKIVEPKTGLVNVEQALGIIGKESGGIDKVALIKQGLGENIPKKMDYNDFRKTVQDQLIPLEKQFSTERSDYGIDRLGYTPGKFVTNEVDGKKIHTYESDYLDNQTILFSNKDKFGRGSGAHGNPDETLGHAHYLIDKESPDVLTITQIQSDAFQGTHRSMPKNIDDAVSKLNKTQANSDDVLELMGDEKEKFKSVFDNADRKLQLDKATVENFTQKSLLDKNHQERYLQELVDYAGKQDYLNKVRVPTSETAAKVQGYRPVTTAEEIIEKYNKLKGTPEWDEIMADTPDADKLRLQKVLEGKIKGDIYDLERTTILKKYSEQPKTIKKLFGEEPKLVTDSKGNTWYEFDIPKKFKEGKGEIKAFSTIGGIGVAGAAASQLQEQKQGGQTNWLNKYK